MASGVPLLALAMHEHDCHMACGATAMRLRAAGLDARCLHGGLDGWQAAGRPTQTQGAST